MALGSLCAFAFMLGAFGEGYLSLWIINKNFGSSHPSSIGTLRTNNGVLLSLNNGIMHTFSTTGAATFRPGLISIQRFDKAAVRGQSSHELSLAPLPLALRTRRQELVWQFTRLGPL